MGEVYRARDPKLGRDVAVKVLLNLSKDPERLRRFEQEARAAAALSHPNILAVFEMGTHEGAPYLASELLEGETLREQVRQGRLPGRKAVDYGVQIARGLAAAHSKGVVHRDLKPENLWVTRDGRLKILDFGLAKLTERESVTDPGAPTRTVGTRPSEVMGTVGYMSPEQVRGQSCDHRTDIFSFGAILYEMLTGNRAFQKPTSAETMTAILNEDPPVTEIAISSVPGLQRVVTRCLEKSPEQRFHSASDLAFAIEALSDASNTSGTVSVREHPAKRWASWALPALACVALGIWLYVRNTTGTKGFSSAVVPLEIRALTESGKVAAAAASPDGRYVAYVDSDAGRYELRLLQVATDTDVQVQPASPLRIWNIHFSPDGNSIFFLRQLDAGNPKYLGVFRVSTLGGLAAPVAGDARMYGLTVSPDGKQIAYISQTPAKSLLMLANADGANQHVLANRPLELGFWFLEWSPSGDQVVAVTDTGEEAMGLVTVSAVDGAMRELSVKGWTTVGEPAWGPDAATIYIPASRPIDTTTQVWAIDAATGASRQITSGPASYSQSGLSTTNVGDLVATTSNLDTAIWVSDRSGRVSRLGSSRGEGLDGVAWVDGKIATCNTDEIRVRDASGHNSRKVRAYSSIYRQVVRCGPSQVAFWAMDGKRHSHIGVIDLETGSAEPQTIGQYDDEPTCNADGSRLVYVHCRDRGQQCAVTNVAPLHSLGAVNRIGWTMPTISPDGTKVLFRQTPDPKKPDEWAAIVPLDGGETKTLKLPVSAEEVEGIRWAPDGKAILYDRNENGVGNIWSASLVGGGVRKITSFDSDRIYAFDVSPDNRLLMSRGSTVRDAVLIKNVR